MHFRKKFFECLYRNQALFVSIPHVQKDEEYRCFLHAGCLLQIISRFSWPLTRTCDLSSSIHDVYSGYVKGHINVNATNSMLIRFTTYNFIKGPLSLFAYRRFWWESQKERDHKEDLDAGGRIMLKRILES
jgi:hypothetical protein